MSARRVEKNRFIHAHYELKTSGIRNGCRLRVRAAELGTAASCVNQHQGQHKRGKPSEHSDSAHTADRPLPKEEAVGSDPPAILQRGQLLC